MDGSPVMKKTAARHRSGAVQQLFNVATTVANILHPMTNGLGDDSLTTLAYAYAGEYAPTFTQRSPTRTYQAI
jgi:hypothetical protein